MKSPPRHKNKRLLMTTNIQDGQVAESNKGNAKGALGIIPKSNLAVAGCGKR